ncbi:hypothetical protein HN011_006876 [Eciton burchellii]|jgi:hypothetical protein|nr:hypothetical protein HN011_006876 [Eciton burchellii]
MESDPATESWSSAAASADRSSSCLEASMPRKFRDRAHRAGTAGLNWALCALCLASFTVSGVLFYRELGLESRIANLEARCQRPVQESSPDVLVQRLKRELQEQLQQATQRLVPTADSGGLLRPKRDVSECNCPPGESL